MDLVDDEYFVAVASGPLADIFPQFPHFVDSAIRRRVDLDHVHRTAGRNLLAARTFAAGVRGRSGDAVQAAGDDAGYGRLSRASLPGEDIPVRDPVLRDGVFKRGADVLLADEFAKLGRPVFPRNDLIHEQPPL